MSEPPQGGAGQGLPEPFAPRGPRLTRFFIHPPAPLRPVLHEEEGRFALRLSLLLGATELCAFGAFASLCARGALPGHAATLALLGWGLLRLLGPLWAALGTRIPRPLVAGLLLGLALLGQGAALLGPLYPQDAARVQLVSALLCGLPALGLLVQSHVADSITVERRQAAWSFLEMGQSLGACLGLSLGSAFPRGALTCGALALVLAGLWVPDLHDRGTPRSTWPRALRREAARTPLGRTLARLGLLVGVGAGVALVSLAPAPRGPTFLLLLLPPLGMALATRLEPRSRNAVELPAQAAAAAGGALLLALLSLLLLRLGSGQGLAVRLVQGGVAASRWLGLFCLGVASTALPAAVARAGPELQRPLLAWRSRAALILGCALSAAAALW